MERKEVMPRLKKGFWQPEEDLILKKYVETHGEGNWTKVSLRSGLMRGAKSCRLRWKNYLRPNIKRGTMSEDEKDLIIRLHKLLGNRWALIAGRLPGRTDNEVKNYWNTHLNKTCCRRKASDHRPKINHNLCPQAPMRDKDSQSTSKGLKRKDDDREGSSLADPRDVHRLDFDMESPALAAYDAPFFYEDEPFLPILDSTVWFESFGSTGEEM
ncbi:hypothetical protein RJ639_032027 [Escallonia herrerae]|uniref:Uncharacterized protein n=1 Tax=Escallonia herrerae TaxID=1293975 RepID=A0AA88X761_9ASTE|nr:hypothetical protein RJ639_032027 [Escallonia herrerae]